MIDITPSTDTNSQVTVGDDVELRWVLDAQVDPADLTFTVRQLDDTETTYSGTDLTESAVTVNGNTKYRYSVEIELASIQTEVQFRLDDAVNHATDTAIITAEPKIT